jgi:protein phosphatase
MTQLTYSIGLQTDKGQQRSHNEDAGAIFNLPHTDAAFVVCDGMGGLRSGDVASGETVRFVGDALRHAFAATTPDPLAVLDTAFRGANAHINAMNLEERQASRPDADTLNEEERRAEKQAVMGTTCVAGVVLGNTLYLAHAGDSRAYRWQRGHLTRLTDDHSFVAERVKAGDMTEEEARKSRFRNMITRAIGIDQELEPELQTIPLHPGDTLLVCSDGLTTMLDDTQIASEMNSPSFLRADPERAAKMLVDAANRKGGEDNITVLILRVTDAHAMPEPQVLDMDAPPPSRTGCAPLALSVLGTVLLLTLALAGLLTMVPGVREKAVQLLGGTSNTGQQENRTPNGKQRDYSRLQYDDPARFADFLVRGDLLTYAPGVGLYFVASTSGKVALLSPDGKALRSVEILDTVGSVSTKTPENRVFMTSDPQGNVYLSFTREGIIKKIGTDGKVLTTIRGFERPEAIAVDDVGNLYVVDYNQIEICRARIPGEQSATPSVFVTPTPQPTPTPRPSGSPKPNS